MERWRREGGIILGERGGELRALEGVKDMELAGNSVARVEFNHNQTKMLNTGWVCRNSTIRIWRNCLPRLWFPKRSVNSR